MSDPQAPAGWTSEWPPAPAEPGFPHELREPPQLSVVDGAYLTKVTRGPLRTIEPPLRWQRGAVHDADGVLLEASQRVGGLGGNPLAHADPSRVRVRDDAPALAGTWLYGGHWIRHFGHFFIETLSTLWPTPDALDPVAGIVFHSNDLRASEIAPWQHDFIAWAGWGALPVEIVAERSTRVERLLLPSRAVAVNGWAHPEAVQVWQRIAAAVGRAPSAGRVFLSRTAFNRRRREAGQPVRTSGKRDRALDSVFAEAGFSVVTPEDLPVIDQVRLAADASVLAGSAGTALHLAAFATPGSLVIELADRRAPTLRVPTQQVIDAALQHRSLFVPHDVEPDGVARVLAALPE